MEDSRKNRPMVDLGYGNGHTPADPECFRYGLFFCPWHIAFVNYSHKRRDIDEVLGICDLAMARTKKRIKSGKKMNLHLEE